MPQMYGTKKIGAGPEAVTGVKRRRRYEEAMERIEQRSAKNYRAAEERIGRKYPEAERRIEERIRAKQKMQNKQR